MKGGPRTLDQKENPFKGANVSLTDMHLPGSSDKRYGVEIQEAADLEMVLWMIIEQLQDIMIAS